MQLPRLAIVDLETTGADPSHDRITEIAILTTEGDQLIEQWSSLINPQVPIPERIQNLIGITDEMVKDAPTFEQLAHEIRTRLDGAIFVAHNARFDFNFLRTYFEARTELFSPTSLCTVKLSRALDPQYPRHGLDAIIERAGYHIESRHRALDDALTVWRFLQDARKRHTPEHFTRSWARAQSQPSLIPRLPTGDLEALPPSPGVYILFGENGQELAIAPAGDLRSQVLGMFTSKKIDGKTKRLAAQVRHVEVHATCGELGSQLLALQLQRQHAQQAITPAYAWLWLNSPEEEPCVLHLKEISGSDPSNWTTPSGTYFGNFRGEREAHTTLRQLAAQNRLCHRRIGLEKTQGACQAYGLHQCNGFCAGKESAEKHDLRLKQTLERLRQKAWPYPHTIQITETHAPTGRTAIHLFNQWCYLGCAKDEQALPALVQQPLRFDADICRLFQRWLATGENSKEAKSIS